MADYAFVPPRTGGPRSGAGVVGPQHHFKTRAPMPDIGDPFNTRNVVRYGDFYHDGKPWLDPGHNINHYSSIPAIQAVMNRFFGFVTHLRYESRIGQPPYRGGMRALGQDVNVEGPGSTTVGDFATFNSYYRERIRTPDRG
jgi:hypothetical protein